MTLTVTILGIKTISVMILIIIALSIMMLRVMRLSIVFSITIKIIVLSIKLKILLNFLIYPFIQQVKSVGLKCPPPNCTQINQQVFYLIGGGFVEHEGLT